MSRTPRSRSVSGAGDGGSWVGGRTTAGARHLRSARRRKRHHMAAAVPTARSKTAPRPARIASCRSPVSTRWPRRKPAAKPAPVSTQRRPWCGRGADASGAIAIGGGSQTPVAELTRVGCESEREPRRPAAGVIRGPYMTAKLPASPLAAPTSMGGRAPRRALGASRSQKARVVAVLPGTAHQLGLAPETPSRR